MAQEEQVPTLATAIISTFVDELATVEGLAEVAERLRAVILEQKIVGEPSIRAAMFPDEL